MLDAQTQTQIKRIRDDARTAKTLLTSLLTRNTDAEVHAERWFYLGLAFRLTSELLDQLDTAISDNGALFNEYRRDTPDAIDHSPVVREPL